MEAIAKCKATDYDIIIMDIMMPKLDGYSAVKEIKKIKNIPVIMLSARGEEYDKLFGFEIGVDDYVVKPFSPKELMARINAVITRSKSNGVSNVPQEKYVYEDESDQRVYKAWLVRERTDEKINIERGRMVIGRSKSLCDYIIFGNETISRRHVFIQNDGHRCVVIDNNSTNFTFLNASKIDPNKEYELSDGDSIRLSNEKFIFHEKFE